MAVSTLPNTIIQKLAKNGAIGSGELEKAQKIVQKSPKPRSLEDVLINDLGYDRHELYKKFCRIYSFREIKLDPKEVSEYFIKFIQEFYDNLPSKAKNAFRERKLIPFGTSDKSDDIMLFITPFPLDQNLTKVFLSGGIKKFEIAYSKLDDVDEILSKAVSSNGNEFLENLENAEEEIFTEQIEEEEQDVDEDELEAAINQSVLVNLFEGCLIEAVRQGSSDIHIVPDADNNITIHFRKDGKLSLWKMQTKYRPEAFFAVVKDRSKNVDRFEWDSAQDGFIQREVDGTIIRFRVSILPVVSGALTRKFESVVIRVLDDRKVITDLDKLGLDEYAKKEFTKAIGRPQGMVILTGPTGSGKSTTLVAALHAVMSPEVNILTVEDPVEYNIVGARQLKIGHKMNFERAIRSILRHDPDIVMVGEIRDQETAEIAIKLANTGHLTFSTLHTNDAVGVVSRLYKMGIEPFLIAYAINLVVAQRLVRKLCPHCKQKATELDPAISYSLDMDEATFRQATFYRPVGCDRCMNGYKGRMGIHEVLPFTSEIRSIILESSGELDENAIRESARKKGMKTLREAALVRAIQGTTSLQEVAAVTIE